MSRLKAGRSSPEREVRVRFLSHPHMQKNNMQHQSELNSLLDERFVVRGKLENFAINNSRILYGETYDQLGITIDSVKYYLLLEYLARMGHGVRPMVVEADLHSVLNKSVVNKQQILNLGIERVKQICGMLDLLGCTHIKVRLMSELMSVPDLVDKVVSVRGLVAKSSGYKDKLAKTVLENKIAQESESGYRYAGEAIGLALNFDLKVGPPRERFYDEVALDIAREIGRKPYGAIYLRPTYPFTSDFSYYLTHPEVEEYGLTPYKAGSNKLQDLRIIIGRTNPDQIRTLLGNTYVPNDVQLANPLVDIALILCLIEQINTEVRPSILGEMIRETMQDKVKLVGRASHLIATLGEVI